MSDYDRRDFLAISALGIAGLVGLGRSTKDKMLLYVGTYTENGRTDGVLLVRMDTSTGTLAQVGAANAGPNPSFLAIHPNGRTLYAVNETASGTVTALGIESRSGALRRLNQCPSGGDAPCYVSVDRHGRVALVANYDSGTVAAIRIAADGSLGHTIGADKHAGHGPNAERQEGPHAHCFISDPESAFALSADLGADRVFVYQLDTGKMTLRPLDGATGVLHPGAGPRHVAFHPALPLVFVADELDSTVTTLHFDRRTGALKTRGTVSTLPDGWKGENFPADIHLDSSGRALYVSNRGHNSIAVFSVAANTGELARVQVIPTEGDWPRNFSLDPTGRWLLVANQRSGNIVVFARNPQTGLLSLTSRQLALPSPVCIRFLVTGE